jgi:uncharacterized membrane protein YbhN (UPF0104 family)
MPVDETAPDGARFRDQLLAGARKVLPWAFAGVLVWLLLRQVSTRETLAALRSAQLGLLVPAALACVLIWFWLDAAVLSYLFTRFHTPFSLSEACSIRALTYLLAVVNWNLGSGGIILHLSHAKDVPLAEAASTMLFYNLIDGLILSAVALVGVSSMPGELGLENVRNGALVLVAVLAGALAFFPSPWKPSWGWMRRLTTLPIFRTPSSARLRDALVVVGYRSVYFAGFIAFFWVALPAFGAHVPLAELAATVPVILLMGTLPITPAGLGTQQAAVVYFYRPYASEAALLAFGFVLPIVFVVMRVPLSLLYLRDLGRLRASVSAVRASR